MEVMEQERVAVSYKSADIKQAIMKGIIALTTYTKKNKYRLIVGVLTEVELDPFDLTTKFTVNIEAALDKSSKKTKKGIYNRLRGINGKITLKKVNTFLHFINTKVLKDANLPKHRFVVTDREERIQISRENWVEARNAADTALKLYKETKADFYKVQKG